MCICLPVCVYLCVCVCMCVGARVCEGVSEGDGGRGVLRISAFKIIYAPHILEDTLLNRKLATNHKRRENPCFFSILKMLKSARNTHIYISER